MVEAAGARRTTPAPGLSLRWLGLLVATVLLITGSAPAAAQDDIPSLLSPGAVDISGSLSSTVHEGAVHALTDGPGAAVSLQARAGSLEYTVRSGTEAGPPWDDDAIKPDADARETTRTFHNLSLEMEPRGGPVEILAYPDGDSVTVRTSAEGTVSHSPSPPAFTTRFGDSPETQRAGAPHAGFWYAPDDGWLIGRGGDEAVVTGGFVLFVSNATVTIREDGEIAWQNWTGRERGTDGGLVHTYEERVFLLTLEDADLHLSAQDQIDVLGSTFAIETTGVVAAGSVEGEIETTAGRFLFDNGPLRLEGSGSLRLAKDSPAALALALDDGDGFSVEGGERVASSDGGASLPSGSSLWWGGAGLIVFVAGAAAIQRVGGPGQALATWRDRQYVKWMTRGRELASGRDFEEAAACFRKAVDAKPNKANAWHHLGMATLEAHDFQGALEIVDEARDRRATVDPLDLLELEAEAAHRAEEIERCRRALSDLADESETMAAGLVRDLALDDAALGPELASRFGDEEERGGLPGYA